MKTVVRMILIALAVMLLVSICAVKYLRTCNRIRVQGIMSTYAFSFDTLRLNKRSFDKIQLGGPAEAAERLLGERSGEFRANYITEAYYQIGWNRYVVLLYAPSKETGELLVTRIDLANSNRVLKTLKGYDKTSLYDNETPFTEWKGAAIDDQQRHSIRTLEALRQRLGELPPLRQARRYCDYTVVLQKDVIYYWFFRADGCEQAETQIWGVFNYTPSIPKELLKPMLYDQIWEQDYPEALYARIGRETTQE